MSLLLEFDILTSLWHLCIEEGQSNTPVHKLGNPALVDDYHSIFALSSDLSYTQRELAHAQLQESWIRFDLLHTC